MAGPGASTEVGGVCGADPVGLMISEGTRSQPRGGGARAPAQALLGEPPMHFPDTSCHCDGFSILWCRCRTVTGSTASRAPRLAQVRRLLLERNPMAAFDWSVLTDLLKSALDIASQIIKILQAAGVFG